MKLHEAETAPNCRRVRIFLAEKGIDVPTVQVDLPGMENRRSPYIERNPMGTLPILEMDDGTWLAESVAICRYFEETHPDPPLMGRDARDRAVVEMWNRRMEHEVAIPIMMVFRNGHPFFKERLEQVAEYAEVSRRQAEKRLAWLDGVVADRPFIAGSEFSIADITALIGIDFGRVSKIGIDEHQNLKRWHEEVSARPSAKA